MSDLEHLTKAQKLRWEYVKDHNCGLCMWFYPIDTHVGNYQRSLRGECRASLPKFLGEVSKEIHVSGVPLSELQGIWPVTLEGDWCRFFEPLKKPEQPNDEER